MKDSNKIIDEDLSFIIKNLDQELSQLSGKKVLITGGAGFLGYYIIKTLLYWNKSNSDLLLPVSFDFPRDASLSFRKLDLFPSVLFELNFDLLSFCLAR